jgi:pescadillo protein
MTFEVDYEIMLNFLELYTNLMKFVNLKLFKDIGMDYPPPLESIDLPFFGFTSFDVRSIQENLSNKSINTNDLNLQSEELQKILSIEEENKKLKNLFKNCVFFIGREIPNEIFSFAVTSCGGVYGDESDNSPFNKDDPRITHFIIDRPAEFITMLDNKEYVQPQWIFDCINKLSLLPVSEYSPGKKLPPHISPFYDYDEEGLIRLKMKKSTIEDENAAEEMEPEKTDTSLNEMLISKNKKKILNKIREEKMKKKRKKPANKITSATK